MASLWNMGENTILWTIIIGLFPCIWIFSTMDFVSKINKVVNSSTSTSFTELDRTKYSTPKYFENTAMFCTKEERPKSQLNGW
jgi:hypothetical protein